VDEENVFKSGIFEKGRRMAWAERNALILGEAVVCGDRDQTALFVVRRFFDYPGIGVPDIQI
jgi:hypothetical protein